MAKKSWGNLFSKKTRTNKSSFNFSNRQTNDIVDFGTKAYKFDGKRWKESKEEDEQELEMSDSYTTNDSDSFASSKALRDLSLNVDTRIADLVNSAPTTLNTLNELAAAIGDDTNHVTTMTNLVGTKVSKNNNQALGTQANVLTISGSTITLKRGDGSTDTVIVPTSPDTHRSISDSVTSTSTTVSASSKAVKSAYDKGNHSHPYSSSSHTHTGLTSGAWSGIKSQTGSGYIDFGPANTSHAHIYTDRPNFYFNKDLLVTGNYVWHQGNDGSGSGLDADLLDGNHASAFALSHSHPYLPLSGGTMTGDITMGSGDNIHRSTHSSGYLVGSYNTVGDNSTKTNPIYTIGSNYQPSDTSLGNMYGIGYGHPNGGGTINTVLDGWGLYVAADGDARIGLGGSDGKIIATGSIRSNHSFMVDGTTVIESDAKIDANKIKNVPSAWLIGDTNTHRSISDSVSSTSTTVSASSKAVKTAYDKGNHSHPYLPSSGGTITGSLHLDNNAGLTSTTSGETLRVLFPGGGAMKNASSSQTGSIKITLPVGMTNGMLTCKVSVYEYTTNESFEVVFGGYNYPSGNTWAHNAFGYIVGSPLATQDYAIRFGYDSNSKACVYIGETNTVWSYPQVSVTELEVGYAGYTKDLWDDNWDVSIATTQENISKTISAANTRVGSKIAGNTVWHSGNDGSGSGLDADKLDGINSGQFLRSDTNDTMSHRIQFQACSTNNWDTMATGSSSQGAFEVYNNGSGNDAFMCFHTGGDYATYFGLDADTNDLAVGGWSKGASKYKIWHAGNDGSGSGLDADLLDGNHASAFALSHSHPYLPLSGGTITGDIKFDAAQDIIVGSTTHSLLVKNTAASSCGLVLRGSNNEHRMQLYGSSTGYGFLDGPWAGWDIKKVPNGIFEVDEGSGLKRVLNSANWSSYITIPDVTPFVEQARVITASYTIPSNTNAMITGPTEFASGVVITVPSNSNLTFI